jgi:saccharopine dehydrogenase-like NADP-dependent oxidoreductase
VLELIAAKILNSELKVLNVGTITHPLFLTHIHSIYRLIDFVNRRVEYVECEIIVLDVLAPDQAQTAR